MSLHDYVLSHTERGECKCGKCIDVGLTPDPQSPHTVDMIFMIVSAVNDPSVEEFKRLTKEWFNPNFQVSPFDGQEHNYMELGCWIGAQGLALQYMALGVSLGLFNLLSGKTILNVSQELALNLAGAGLLSIQSKG